VVVAVVTVLAGAAGAAGVRARPPETFGNAAAQGTAPSSSRQADTTRSGAPSGGKNGPTPAQVMLSTMHQMDLAAEKLGELARSRAVSPTVRRYGDRLYRDHQYADRQAQDVARDERMKLLPESKLPASSKLDTLAQRMNRLRQASGGDFDGMFLQLAVRSHTMAADLLSDGIGKLPPGPVRRLASHLLPVLRQDLRLGQWIRNGKLGT